MSQKDRQLAYQQAREHHDELRELIERHVNDTPTRAVMLNVLELLWAQADHAAGGQECRP